ncbi:hypothetical protein ABW20_dc0108255 [Dactylellina cionopaga]|nr:hypothetical protein ABW20_dc0108255 [Dactylellina cionopaga]
MSSDAGQALASPSVDLEVADSHPEPQKPTDIPLLVVEKTSDDNVVYGSIPGSEAYEQRSMDTKPDILQEYEDTTLTNGHPNPKASPLTPAESQSSLPTSGPSEGDTRTLPLSSTSDLPEMIPEFEAATEDDGGDDNDDFDDFGEAIEGDDDFGDFGDFDAAEPDAQVEASNADVAIYQQQAQRPAMPDFIKMSRDEMKTRIDEIISSLYSQAGKPSNVPLPPLPATNGAFLTERSQSLWTQLCTPPPLQPPNWKLSRIRRLFLVSLGVPVDLDEILPADTKQKKLVLPSSSHARKSSDVGRGDGERSTRSSSRRRKEKEAQAKLVDVPSARILCSTSDVRLRAFTVGELEEHVKKLEEVTREASETLTYWLGRRETAMGDKEAFERVIENLVEFAKKKR